MLNIATKKLLIYIAFLFFLTGCGAPGSEENAETPNPKGPNVVLSSNLTTVSYNGSITLDWSTSNLTSCIASGDWSGSRSTAGSEIIGSLVSDSTFTLNCTGANGDASDTVDISVGSISSPTVSLSANPTNVVINGSTTLNWSSTNATDCTASGDWSGSKGVSGSQTTNALTVSSTFNLSCSGTAGTANDTVDVTVVNSTPVVDSIVDKNVTWNFGQMVENGSFANGDPWVVGPVTIVSITPNFTGSRHGWEVNPSSTLNQGFDSRIYSFNSGLVPSLPYIASPNESLVKAVSVSGGCNVPCLQSVSVLTVLSTAPPNSGANTFRPSYFGTDKTLHSTDDLQLNLLPNLAPTPNAVSFSTIVSNFSALQLDHQVGWTARAMHPIDSMPDYGAAIAVRNAEGALALMMQGTTSEKMQATINYVNYGLDVYYQLIAGVTWPSDGGHGEGRKLPAVMAAVLLNNASMLTDLTGAPRTAFGETNGARFSAIAGMPLWGQWIGELTYWERIVQNQGSKFIRDPYGQIDGGEMDGPALGYQFCCNSKPWEAIVAAVRLMPALASAMNANDLDAYVTRWRASGFHTQPDSCAPATNSMNDYGVLFGPDGAGGCIPDLDPSDGIGRFPQMHGQSASGGFYESQFSNELWNTYL